MAQLSADTARQYATAIDPNFDDVPAAASATIYRGSAVGKSSGYGRQLVAADVFMGFADEACDNSAGTAGAKNIRVRGQGKVVLSVTGVTAVTDHGATVYASDGNTFTLTSTSNTAIGKITRYISGTTVEVFFQAAPYQSI